MDARWPGARTSAIARTRLIDEWASAAASQGMRQAVILGAGFDCRAWRLTAFRELRIFEVDHPATSPEKRRVIGDIGAPTERVSFAPIDFEQESLAEALAKVGFDANRPTLVIWEGVTNYLTAEAVDATLRSIAALAEGSQLIFTYVDADLINGADRFRDAASARRAVTGVGEPWTFGLRPEALPVRPRTWRRAACGERRGRACRRCFPARLGVRRRASRRGGGAESRRALRLDPARPGRHRNRNVADRHRHAVGRRG